MYFIPINITILIFQVDIQVAPQNPPGKDKSTPVWVIIVAVLGGILLLALAILALFKVSAQEQFIANILLTEDIWGGKYLERWKFYPPGSKPENHPEEFFLPNALRCRCTNDTKIHIPFFHWTI
jgi:hypothetical protein